MFNVGDIVTKSNGTQKYKVVKVLENDKYEVQLYPFINDDLTLVFSGSNLVLVS